MKEVNEQKFFDSYPEFYLSSKTRASPNRLNTRYKGLISNNKKIIQDQKILDLASHDGRWAFAALKNGAKYVQGIEVRDELIAKSKINFNLYGVDNEQFSFVSGDIFKEIEKIEPESFDTIFCFGIFYHIINHMELLYKMKKMKPKFVIIDSAIAQSDLPTILIREENIQIEGNSIKKFSPGSLEITGRPSKIALEMMLKNLNFSYEYVDWYNMGIENWDDLEKYKDGRRITIIAKNNF